MEFLKPVRLVSILNRKKDDPSKFVFTGNLTIQETDIQLFKYRKEAFVEEKNISPDILHTFEKNGYNYWLNIYGLNETATIASICEKQGIHSLVIQDILDVNQRPKFQEYEYFSFLTLKSIVPSENEMITEQISFVFGVNFLISFQERKADFFEHLRIRIREDKGILRERSADYLLYAMLESILDNYFKTLSRVDEEIEKFNFTNTKKEPSPNALELIENHKKFVHFIKKSILPIKEFAQIVERGECHYIEKKHLKYFLEIKDLCLTLIDNSDMILSSLESQTNLFFSVQGHRMNQVMKTLTIVATIFIPLTFIAGIYGMNFSNMPELEWKYGYVGIWSIMLSVFFGMVIYFRRKKWF
ncbi:magnesium/cobalt transporter CorA [Mongoliitalea daihaiensis]|uniref:magnesium/cobalt transporter CorA n=1 Tax=Mongoliitalea daihaiensis TaxID=2782006 RepID=UPI001F19977B|nr:magnesium/cobalt transporter CorA [Mongoliitalea daihaiensis]UJP63789.1 magnesium/cobalt transporter CorA [Mongoliitalea daihaiensis]